MADPALELHHTLKQIEELAQTGQGAQARKLAGQVLKLYPDNADAWFAAYLTVDQADQKVKVLQRVLSLKPSHLAARQALEDLRASPSSSGEARFREPEALATQAISNRTLLIVELGAIISLIACIVSVLVASSMRQRQLDTAALSTAEALTQAGFMASTAQPTGTDQTTLLPTATYPSVPPPELAQGAAATTIDHQ